jgi:hypothetical protein
MKQELRDNLLEYLGELKCSLDATYDWLEKNEINKQINVVNTLLGFQIKKEPSWFESIQKEFTSIKEKSSNEIY